LGGGAFLVGYVFGCVAPIALGHVEPSFYNRYYTNNSRKKNAPL
jgi:hypothetical protein